jgi:hypothetical protein
MVISGAVELLRSRGRGSPGALLRWWRHSARRLRYRLPSGARPRASGRTQIVEDRVVGRDLRSDALTEDERSLSFRKSRPTLTFASTPTTTPLRR